MVTIEIEKTFGDVVIGIDEAGRGPLVGGVYAGAVTVPLARAEELLHGAWSEINDSKKLSEKKRERLAEIIRTTEGCRWAVASASPAEIDELNILRATHLAMRRAAEAVDAKSVRVTEVGHVDSAAGVVQARLTTRTDFASTALRASPVDAKSVRVASPVDAKSVRVASRVTILVDGLPVPNLPHPSQNVIKGDAKSLLIAAASILAKTARDADCLRLEALYPGYGFAKHKGYPTKDHLAALAKLGPCPEHRRSFGPVASLIQNPSVV